MAQYIGPLEKRGLIIYNSQSFLSCLEPLHNQGNHHVSLLVGELLADGQQHQHIVTIDHTHCVEVTEYVGTRYPTLKVWIVDEGIEEVCGLNQGGPGLVGYWRY